MAEGITKKIYLELTSPTEEDSRSDMVRIQEAFHESGLDVHIPLRFLRKLYPLCGDAEWKITVSLAWNGENWTAVNLEAGDRTMEHYGYALDLGSTTAVLRLMDCNTGECLGEAGSFNRQIAFGTDILTRIFYCKDNSEKLAEMQKATIDTIKECMVKLEKLTGISSESCISMVVSGNTTMIHFLLGLDAFCVFYTPYAVHADRPEFIPANELEMPVGGYVYCYPSKSNYLGGDIISGMVATEIYKKDDICTFFDIGTNGELVVGNKEFLLCGAGAAGPALEGGVVKTGMRADKGAVDRVKIENGKFQLHVIGEGESKGICGSGIIELLAELFLNGWVDIRGKFMPEKSPLIRQMDESFGVEYAPGLFFYQEDIDEFIRTKAAAYTMVEIMLKESGISMDEISEFYVAGAFGKHVSKEAAITIGMYPDIDRDRIISAGNSSLDGAEKLLLDKNILNELDEILENMVYIQFGAVDDFLGMMVAAQALPHTDMKRFPSVAEKLDSSIDKR